ncbi:ABC transporter permease [Methanolobus chelungpuianus]|uniref:Sulfonate ABC transporter permease n=1 Tax=Methanolobus chelungpuianus TaxID=502115 RepID=A0AAE3H9R4_9EURY|nr:ABC transporter permease [Methanolobus chelungpuianus]MCQ6962702.1 sulfonate ABC transporter permease [Methanolobus chelungpuianus]
MARGRFQKLKNKGVEILSVISAVIIWQLVADYIVRNRFFLPSFTDVAEAFLITVSRQGIFPFMGMDMELPVLLVDTLYSLMHFSIGLVAALVIGIPVGMIMGWFRSLERVFDPIIEIIRPIPPLAWIPFAIIWIGLNPFGAGFVIFVGALFPIIINTFTGFKSVPRIYVEAAKVLGCTADHDLIRRIAIPSALPSIAAGIRIAMGVGWMCLVAAEMFGVSRNGLGFKIWHNYYLHRMDFVLVYMLVLGFLGLLIDRAFRSYLEEKFFKWRTGVVM